MSTPPKRPKTVNRLQRLITEWERDYDPAGRTHATGTSSTCNSSKP
jgi:hypothetical protein